jgi:hypothetical protein
MKAPYHGHREDGFLLRVILRKIEKIKAMFFLCRLNMFRNYPE